MDKAVTYLLEMYQGEDITKWDLDEVAKKFHVLSKELGNTFLKKGLQEGWLFDEYFKEGRG